MKHMAEDFVWMECKNGGGGGGGENCSYLKVWL